MKCEIKYAPRNLDEVIYPSVSVERRIKGYASGQLEGNIILYGSNGTGKTTLANLLVKQLGGSHPQTERCDAEELLAKPDLKLYLRQAAAMAAITTSEKHFMVLNEFDNAKKNASKFWTALDACGSGVMAIITTNEPMDIHKSVRSRCDLIEMPGISARAALERIQYCLACEGLDLPDQQVLAYLSTVEQYQDLRKYFKLADELLYLWRSDLPMPNWSGKKPSIHVV
jgi:replication-associated recombination protein RarA